jgi:hypothetical protein
MMDWIEMVYIFFIFLPVFDFDLLMCMDACVYCVILMFWILITPDITLIMKKKKRSISLSRTYPSHALSFFKNKQTHITHTTRYAYHPSPTNLQKTHSLIRHPWPSRWKPITTRFITIFSNQFTTIYFWNIFCFNKRC